jgi:hypothetical protein
MKQEIVDEVLELAELRLLLELDPMHLLGIHISGSDPELSAGYVDAGHVEPQVSPSARQRAGLHHLPDLEVGQDGLE